ncbi:MAG: DUF1697 domain-containing protein [Minisyncoccia bacterium]
MTTYVALLRGIMPMNPNMRSAKLKEAFEKMGLKNVKTVIASGNVVFDSPKNAAVLEALIEKSLPELIGFKSTTLIRSTKEIEALVRKNPLKKSLENPKLYPIVTFLKMKSRTKLPKKGEGYIIYGAYEREICIAINKDNVQTSLVMRLLEKKFDKAITMRTWRTVERILKTMHSP